MGTVTEGRLSESDGGRPIGIARDASPGTLLHVGPIDLDSYDKIRLYVANVDGADHTLFLQWGGVAATDLLPVNIPAALGLVLNIPLLILEGQATALELRAYGDAADVLNATGTVLLHSAMGIVDFQDRTSA